jgi:hypothetical protein
MRRKGERDEQLATDCHLIVLVYGPFAGGLVKRSYHVMFHSVTWLLSIPVLQVWDSTSAACLHTLGPGTDDGTAGHKKKISAMAVNQFHSCKHPYTFNKVTGCPGSICWFWMALLETAIELFIFATISVLQF